MGLQAGANLFVDPATGDYERFAYLPAFVRRYPFVAANHGPDSDRFTICVDTGSHLFSDNPEQPFFDDKGERPNSPTAPSISCAGLNPMWL
ncbi:MAG: SapC family protein [Oceanicaulis sp.]|nr:SapC family protein [Oceanicaulis sp.]